MGSGIGKQLAKKAVQTSTGALERVEALEKAVDNLTKAVIENAKGQQQIMLAVRQALGMVDARLGEQTELTKALVNIVGVKPVMDEVRRAQIEDLENKSLLEKAAFDEGVKEGKVVKVDAVSERSVIIGSEVGPDGEALHPLRVQLFFGTLKEEFRPAILGKVVGDVIETPAGTKFTIGEIWDVVVTESTEAAPDAPVEAEQVDAAPQVADEPVTGDAEQKLVEELAEALPAVDGTPSQSN